MNANQGMHAPPVGDGPPQIEACRLAPSDAEKIYPTAQQESSRPELPDSLRDLTPAASALAQEPHDRLDFYAAHAPPGDSQCPADRFAYAKRMIQARATIG